MSPSTLAQDAVKNSDKEALELRLAGQDPRTACMLALDEFAIQEGHSFATVVVDIESGAVLWLGRGSSRADIWPFFEAMREESRNRIEAVAIDYNATYALKIQENCPKARIIYVLFQIVARCGREGIDHVRVDEENLLRDDKDGR